MTIGAKVLAWAVLVGIGFGLGKGAGGAKPRKGESDPAKVFVVTAVVVDGTSYLIQDREFAPDRLPDGSADPDGWRYDLPGGVALKATRIDRAKFTTARPDLQPAPAPAGPVAVPN